MSNTLKLSDSHIEGGSTANPQYKKYEDKLRQMKNQDGEIDVAELCQVLDEASTIEKHRKLLRGACYVLAVFSLLTIAVIVGLTYAIVDLTQDSQVSSSDILVTKNSAANPVATGRALLFDDASQLFNKDLADLSDLEFLILPGGKTGAGTVVHVAEVELDPNTSAKVTTTTGAVYEIDASGIHQVNKTSGGRRRLLQTTVSATSGFTSSSTDLSSDCNQCTNCACADYIANGQPRVSVCPSTTTPLNYTASGWCCPNGYWCGTDTLSSFCTTTSSQCTTCYPELTCCDVQAACTGPGVTFLLSENNCGGLNHQTNCQCMVNAEPNSFATPTCVDGTLVFTDTPYSK